LLRSVNANVARTPSDYSSLEDEEDEEADTGLIEEDEDEDLLTPRPRQPDDDDLLWDDIDPADGRTRTTSFRHEGPGELLPATGTPQPILLPPAQETTPLLRKTISFSHDAHPDHEHLAAPPPKVRRVSSSSVKSVKYEYTGKSTFGQTVGVSVFICCTLQLTPQSAFQ
jgi:hypothetical protein